MFCDLDTVYTDETTSPYVPRKMQTHAGRLNIFSICENRDLH